MIHEWKQAIHNIMTVTRCIYIERNGQVGNYNDKLFYNGSLMNELLMNYKNPVIIITLTFEILSPLACFTKIYLYYTVGYNKNKNTH